MKKIIIAVCDNDGTYGEKLGEWISLEHGERLSGRFFSSPEYFWECFNCQTPDIVLLGDGFLGDTRIRAELLRREGVGEEHLKESGEESLWLYLEQREQKKPSCVSHLPVVDKYQPASRLLREVFFHYQNWGNREISEAAAEQEIIGIYSPGHSIWQTPFALTFAQALEQKERVLYVNFMECAGFSSWFQEEYERDLLDVMYLCLTNDISVPDCVSSACHTMEGVDYIPPAKDGGCLGEISSQDYIRFVRLLSSQSGYDAVILDFGMMVPGFYQLLELCSQVYIVTEPGEMRQASLMQFREMVARQEEGGLEQKLIYLSLPIVDSEPMFGATWLQQWLWGAIGDFSRRLAGVQCGTD